MDDLDEPTLEAFSYYWGELYPEASLMFARLLARDPNNAQAWKGYHFSLAKQGRDSEARDAIQRSLNLDQTDTEAWFALAIFLYERGQESSTALDAFERGLELNPDEPHMWFRLAVLCKRTGQLTKGEQVIRKALELSPDNDLHLTALESILREQGRIVEADEIKAHQEALEAQWKREQEELDRQNEELLRSVGLSMDESEDPDLTEEPEELDYITRLYEEDGEKPTPEEDGPLVPNPRKTDISGLFDDDPDIEDVKDLFDTDNPISEDESEEDEDDGMDALGNLFYSE